MGLHLQRTNQTRNTKLNDWRSLFLHRAASHVAFQANLRLPLSCLMSLEAAVLPLLQI
jgi:hypothetical protein